MRHRHFDVAGAISVTSGVMLLVYAMTRAAQDGWEHRDDVSLLGGSAALIAAFIAIELRSPAPLLPMRIFRLAHARRRQRNRRRDRGDRVLGVLPADAVHAAGTGLLGGPDRVAFAAITFTIVVFANVAQTLVTRFGVRVVLATGLALDALALALLTQLPVDGHYFWNMFPAFLISGVGLAFSFVPVTIAGLAGVDRADAGIASGLINTTRQVGGAVGLAAVTTIVAASTTTGSGLSVTAVDSGLTNGFQVGFLVLAGLALVGAVIAATLLAPQSRQRAEVEVLVNDNINTLEEAA